ncbi:MAG: putative threonine dehydratase [Gemmatimonadetes bacterium]|nr:putative threonine dehydratase [Gemmatimonadota bacterium]
MFSDLKATDVLAAAARIADTVKRTPLIQSEPLSAIAGVPVHLKLETRQTTGSFKLRGATNALATLPPHEQARGVVASSAGNHGLGIAYAARALGMPARIFVPASAPDVKKRGIRELGAELDDSQPDYDAAMAKAIAWGAEHRRTFINPCDGDTLLAGQGTVALEILQELPRLGTLVVSVGGGGLVGGCASLVRRVAPWVRIVGVQSVLTAAMARSLAAGHLVDIPSVPTLADGLAGQVDEAGLDVGRHAIDEMVLVEEAEIAAAIAWMSREHGERVEGAGAAGVAALLGAHVTNLRAPVAVIVCGGNIDDARFRAITGTGGRENGQGGMEPG